MTAVDPYLMVRAAAVYLPVVATLAVTRWRRPTRHDWAGVLLACAWNVPAVLLLNVVAMKVGWWHFDAEGGLFLGVPVDLYLAWVWLWGALPLLAGRQMPLGVLAAVLLVADLTLMPAAAPVVILGPHWLAGEAAGLAAAFAPGHLLGRWTRDGRHLPWRAALQMVVFGALVLVMLPAIAIAGSGGAWLSPLDRPGWVLSLWAQILAVPAVIGLTAVQEFVERGGGTPIPLDPPVHLVTSGIYGYVRNPMQLSAVALVLLLGVALGNWWVGAAGVMAHLYSSGIATWDEDGDLTARFGDRWRQYRNAVRRWRPRLRPWHAPDAAPARLYVAGSCAMCREVGQWFDRRGAERLLVVDAASHPSRALQRITYEPGDGTAAAAGVVAVARALEHVHLGWACAGFFLRLPGVSQTVQLLLDASGGERRAAPGATAAAAGPASWSRRR